MSNERQTSRRGFIITAGASLAAAYGLFAAFMARFLYPKASTAEKWTYVSTTSNIPTDEALVYRTPGGAVVNIARSAEDPNQMIALSSTCPHLGCQVHWEPHNQRFFCPCHNGVFDPSGRAIAGPPADAGQSLLQYPVKSEGELIFIQVPPEDLASGTGGNGATQAGGACQLPKSALTNLSDRKS